MSSWWQYLQDCKGSGVPKSEQKSLLNFRFFLRQCLIKMNMPDALTPFRGRKTEKDTIPIKKSSLNGWV